MLHMYHVPHAGQTFTGPDELKTLFKVHFKEPMINNSEPFDPET